MVVIHLVMKWFNTKVVIHLVVKWFNTKAVIHLVVKWFNTKASFWSDVPNDVIASTMCP